MIFKVDGWLDHFAEGVQDVEVAAGIGPQHVFKGPVAEFPDGVEELKVCDGEASVVDHTGIYIPEFAEQIGGEFALGFDVLNGLPLFEVICVTGLDPLSEAAGGETLGGFAQFIEDDVVRQTIVEHHVEHVARRFRKAGNSWLMVCG